MIILVAFRFTNGNDHWHRETVQKRFEVCRVLASGVNMDMEHGFRMPSVERFDFCAKEIRRWSWFAESSKQKHRKQHLLLV